MKWASETCCGTCGTVFRENTLTILKNQMILGSYYL